MPLVFVEFNSPNYPAGGGKHYFVGKNLEVILEDTGGGKKYAGAKFDGHREITREEAARLDLNGFETLAEDVENGTSTHEYLGLSH